MALLLLQCRNSCAFSLGVGSPLLTASVACPRVAALDMSTWPHPSEAIHMVSINIGGAMTSLALREMPTQTSAALLPLWRLQHSTSADGLHSWSHCTSAGPMTKTCFGVHLNGVDSPVNAVALVRFESAADAGNIMVIDAVIVEPSAPYKLREPLQTAAIAALCAIGEAHDMTVQKWTDYDA